MCELVVKRSQKDPGSIALWSTVEMPMGAGEVIAEERTEGLTPYLGSHPRKRYSSFRQNNFITQLVSLIPALVYTVAWFLSRNPR